MFYIFQFSFLIFAFDFFVFNFKPECGTAQLSHLLIVLFSCCSRYVAFFELIHLNDLPSYVVQCFQCLIGKKWANQASKQFFDSMTTAAQRAAVVKMIIQNILICPLSILTPPLVWFSDLYDFLISFQFHTWATPGLGTAQYIYYTILISVLTLLYQALMVYF